MKIGLGCNELYLREGQPLRLNDAGGVVIRCIAGTIWITMPGEISDIVLEPGACQEIQGRGLVLIESIGDGRIGLELPAQGHPVKQHTDWLFRLLRATSDALRQRCGISRTDPAASVPGFPV